MECHICNERNSADDPRVAHPSGFEGWGILFSEESQRNQFALTSTPEQSVGAGHAPPARVALPFRAADGLPLLSRASNVRLPASGLQPLKRSPSARQGLSFRGPTLRGAPRNLSDRSMVRLPAPSWFALAHHKCSRCLNINRGPLYHGHTRCAQV